MKKGLSIREKVLLAILGVLAAVMVYNYLFLIPIQEEIAQAEAEYLNMDETIILLDAKTAKYNQMKEELEVIKAGQTEDTKALPQFDNRENLMVQLSNILAKTEKYSLVFGTIGDDGVTVSRSVTLNFTCDSYETAKGILMEIRDGEYPCTFGNLYLSNEGMTVSVNITYFEYK